MFVQVYEQCFAMKKNTQLTLKTKLENSLLSEQSNCSFNTLAVITSYNDYMAVRFVQLHMNEIFLHGMIDDIKSMLQGRRPRQRPPKFRDWSPPWFSRGRDTDWPSKRRDTPSAGKMPPSTLKSWHRD